MGFEAAEQSARALVDAGSRALVSWGLAGGLDPRLSPGTLIVPERLVIDGARDLSADLAWREQVLEVLGGAQGRAGIKVPIEAGGKLLTSRRPLTSAADKRTALLEFGAIAVDMESYAVAAVAAGRGLPFVAIRDIVDAADDEVPAALLDAADARGRLAAGRLLVRMLGSPRSVMPFLGLAGRYNVARRSLRAAAQAGAPGSP